MASILRPRERLTPYTLGHLARDGLKSAACFTVAYKCFTQAAASGHLGAQTQLGRMYEQGIG